jgi:hypothetical protein
LICPIAIGEYLKSNACVSGIAMAMHAGMVEYLPLPKTGKLVRFMFDIEKSNSFLALAYKEGFEEWKKEQKK